MPQRLLDISTAINVPFIQTDHISEAQKSLKWLNVKEKLLFNDLGMVYKCVNNLTPEYLCERFQHRSEIHQRDTR